MGGPIGFAEFAKRIIKENRELKNSIGAKYKDIQAGSHQDGKKPLRFKKADVATKKSIQYRKEQIEKQIRFKIGVVITVFIFIVLTLLFIFL